MKKLFHGICILAGSILLLTTYKAGAQNKLLKSGPMVGYSEMREVMLWVQTTQQAKVKIEYWEKGKELPRFTTAEIKTTPENAYVAKILADKVLPGKKYSYKLFIDGKPVARPYPLEFQSQELWQYRKPASDFTFALGSCNYINDTAYDRPGTPYGGGYEIFNSIYQKKPDFMVWLGDNIYLREADWNTQTGIYHRYTHTRSLPEMQPLLGSVHQYAILDDHDFGPNDSDRGFWNKNQTINAFNLFWCNPNTNVTGKGGVTGSFQWGDAQFFLMDDRSFRSPNFRKTGEKSYLGKHQVDWLIDALIYSNARFKFVCIGGQVLNPMAVYENYSNYAEELQYLLSEINAHKVKGVIFLSGDRHMSELTKLDRAGTYPLYDLTVSPLTSGTHDGKENNYLRVDGTRINQKNFAVIKVAGGKEDRNLTISLYASDGKLLWERNITAKEISQESGNKE